MTDKPTRGGDPVEVVGERRRGAVEVDAGDAAGRLEAREEEIGVALDGAEQPARGVPERLGPGDEG